MFKYTLVVCTADKSFSPAVFNAICLVVVYDDHCPAAVAHIAHVAVTPSTPARVDARYSIPLLLLLLCASFVTFSLTTLVTGAGVDCKITLRGQTTDEAVPDVLTAEMKRSVRQKLKPLTS